ncbi:hypothetical protein P4131_30150 [Pseudomonas aeruginosa]|nr:hypothetical protein [Pseudomonas aeruginosa]
MATATARTWRSSSPPCSRPPGSRPNRPGQPRRDVVWDLLVPGMYAPNHAIVRAEVDGETWWLDPTNPVFAPGRTMPDIQQRWALVLGADGKVRRDEIPWKRPATPCA